MVNYNKKINLLLDFLKKQPIVDRIYVVGSVAEGKKNPGDLDILVDFSDKTVNNFDPKQISFLLQIGHRRFTKVEGLFDPFVLIGKRLIVRNDSSTDWQRAKNAKELLRSFQSSKKKLKDVNRLPETLEEDKNSAATVNDTITNKVRFYWARPKTRNWSDLTGGDVIVPKSVWMPVKIFNRSVYLFGTDKEFNINNFVFGNEINH